MKYILVVLVLLLLALSTPAHATFATLPAGDYCKVSGTNKAILTIGDGTNQFSVALSGLMICAMSGTYALDGTTNQVTWSVTSSTCGTFVSILASSYTASTESISVTISAYGQTASGTASKSNCATAAPIPSTAAPTGNGQSISLGKYCGTSQGYSGDFTSKANFEFYANFRYNGATPWNCYASGTYIMTSDTNVMVSITATDCEVVFYPDVTYTRSSGTIEISITLPSGTKLTETLTEAKCVVSTTSSATTVVAPTVIASSTAAPLTTVTVVASTAPPTTATAAATVAPLTTVTAATTVATTNPVTTVAPPTTATSAVPQTSSSAAPTTAPTPAPTQLVPTNTYCSADKQISIVIVDSGIVINFFGVPCAFSGSYAMSASSSLFALSFHSSSTCDSTQYAISALRYNSVGNTLTMTGTQTSSSVVSSELSVGACPVASPSVSIAPLSVVAMSLVLEGTSGSYVEMVNTESLALHSAIKEDLAALFGVNVNQITITKLTLGSLDIEFTISDVPETDVSRMEGEVLMLTSHSSNSAATGIALKFKNVVSMYETKGGDAQDFLVGSATVDDIINGAAPTSAPTNDDHGNAGPLIGGILGAGVVGVILIIVGVLGWRRKRSQQRLRRTSMVIMENEQLEEQLVNEETE